MKIVQDNGQSTSGGIISSEKQTKRKLADATPHEWHLMWLEIMQAFKVSLREDTSEEREKKFHERFKKALRWFRANGPKIKYSGMRYSTI